MSPFLRNSVPDQNGLDSDDDDDAIYNDIVDQRAQTKEKLEECQLLTDHKNLQEKLQTEDVKLESLKQILDSKTKQLRELNEQLKRKKTDAVQHQNQRSHSFDVVAEIFKDTKKFSSKAGHEISQTFTSLGFEIEYECIDHQAVVKIRKNRKWLELGLNEHLKLMLVNMNPRHSRFDEIKILFDRTRNIAGLFSIYNWSLNE